MKEVEFLQYLVENLVEKQKKFLISQKKSS